GCRLAKNFQREGCNLSYIRSPCQFWRASEFSQVSFESVNTTLHCVFYVAFSNPTCEPFYAPKALRLCMVKKICKC
ncbi:hypothetical protein E2562_015553, partial [Oryza meyeriana var. granulata]